jgi:hypothetical protein
MEAPLLILLFFGVIFITAVLFIFWLVIASIRGMIRTVTRIATPPPKRQPVLLTLRCRNDHCLASNAPNARFCRRCGQQLTDQRRHAVPRVAMW